jgi:hypothetical protein
LEYIISVFVYQHPFSNGPVQLFVEMMHNQPYPSMDVIFPKAIGDMLFYIFQGCRFYLVRPPKL